MKIGFLTACMPGLSLEEIVAMGRIPGLRNA
jgi:hypothetical protein